MGSTTGGVTEDCAYHPLRHQTIDHLSQTTTEVTERLQEEAAFLLWVSGS
jgi:hypothetical protein